MLLYLCTIYVVICWCGCLLTPQGIIARCTLGSCCAGDALFADTLCGYVDSLFTMWKGSQAICCWSQSTQQYLLVPCSVTSLCCVWQD
jgi:hypothetical protein